MTLTRSPTRSSGDRLLEESSDRAMATWPSSMADVMCAGELDAWREDSEMEVPAVCVVSEVWPATSETLVAASVGQYALGTACVSRSASVMVSPAATSRLVTTTLTEFASFLAMIAEDSATRMPENTVAPTDTAMAAAATTVSARVPFEGPAGAGLGAARRGAVEGSRPSAGLASFLPSALPKRPRRFSSRLPPRSSAAASVFAPRSSPA